MSLPASLKGVFTLYDQDRSGDFSQDAEAEGDWITESYKAIGAFEVEAWW